MPSDSDTASDAARHHERLAGEITASVLGILRKAASEGRLPADFTMAPRDASSQPAAHAMGAPAVPAIPTSSGLSPAFGSPVIGAEDPLVRKPGAPPPAPRSEAHAGLPRRQPGTGTIRAAIQSAAREFVRPEPAVEIVRYRIALLILVLCLSALVVALAVSLNSEI